MSQMLKSAIIDAEALKEQALKNAEALVVEKFSGKIKEAVNKLLEADDDLGDDEFDMGDMDLGGGMPGDAMSRTEEQPLETEVADQVPLAANDDETLCPCEEEDEEIEINFDDLERQLASDDDDGLGDHEEIADEIGDDELEGLMEAMEELEETPNSRARAVNDPRDRRNNQKYLEENDEEELCEGEGCDELDEDINIDEIVDEIHEELKVDTDVSSDGWLGTNRGELGQMSDKAQAKRASSDGSEDEVMDLKGQVDNLRENNKKLKNQKNKLSEDNKKLKELLNKYKVKLSETNLKRAHLYYTNKVLVNNSLNERQKEKIVETLAETKTVERAKLIYETLQTAVDKKVKKSPKNLREAAHRGPVAQVLKAQKEPEVKDARLERMKKLAGIKN